MSKATYPLKLPASIKAEAARLAKEDGVSLISGSQRQSRRRSARWKQRPSSSSAAREAHSPET